MPEHTQQEIDAAIASLRYHLRRIYPSVIEVTPEQARRVLLAFKSDVNPAAMGAHAYRIFEASLEHVAGQFEVTL